MRADAAPAERETSYFYRLGVGIRVVRGVGGLDRRRHLRLADGDALRCAGTFSQGIISAFSVNTGAPPAGNGMSITTEPSGWTCDELLFGPTNGCDCDCGVRDPACGAHDCTHFSVTATFTYIIDGATLPALNLVKGRTYVFDVNATGHPFAIHSVPNNISQTARYNDGVTNQGDTQGQLKFTPPLAAPATVYYQCENHSFMSNALNLANP